MAKFFKTPSPVWFTLIIGGLAIHALTAFTDGSRLFHWPLIGSFLLYLNNNYKCLLQLMFVTAVVVHTLEAYYAYRLAVLLNLCTNDVMKWTIQTTLLGFPSLHIIQQKYREDNKQQQ